MKAAGEGTGSRQHETANGFAMDVQRLPGRGIRAGRAAERGATGCGNSLRYRRGPDDSRGDRPAPADGRDRQQLAGGAGHPGGG